MKLHSISVGGLSDFLQSDLYLNATNCPISRHRAISQAHNPRAHPEDTALILAIKQDQIVGYIGLLPDWLEGEKVYWNSCWWVDESHRSVAMPLFFQFIKSSNKNVLLTDMPAHTQKIVAQLKGFEFRTLEPGLKLYLGIQLKKWLPRRFPLTSGLRPLLGLADKSFNFCYSFLLKRSKRFSAPDYQLLDKLEASDLALMERCAARTLLQRAGQEGEWIRRYPWVLPEADSPHSYESYHFTALAKKVDFSWYRLNISPEKKAIFLVRNIDGHLFAPLIFARVSDYHQVARFLYFLALQQRAVALLVYHPLLVAALKSLGKQRIFQKTIPRVFAYHKNLASFIPPEIVLQDGDGDVAFC
jgi:hypothetical protein